MSQILKPLFILATVLASYAGIAAVVVFVSMSARAQAPRETPEPGAAAAHAPITSVEQAQEYVRHILPNVRVAAAYVDAEPQPHYHVELRLADGRTGRLDVDPRTGALAWRDPAILND